MPKTIKQVKGYGVVGTWVSPYKLGGALPSWLSNDEKEALHTAPNTSRLMEFLDSTEQWLCEITIKPIRKVRANTETVFK